jgi:hypothetical protein
VVSCLWLNAWYNSFLNFDIVLLIRLISLVFCEIEVVIMVVIYMYAYVVVNMFFMVEFYYNNIVIYVWLRMFLRGVWIVCFGLQGNHRFGFKLLGDWWIAPTIFARNDCLCWETSSERNEYWYFYMDFGGSLLSHPVLEGKPNANHVRARISYSRTQQLHNMDIITQCSK